MTRYLLPLAGYLLGSISFAIVIVRLATGRDVRTIGSGNAGATNVLRAAGKSAAIATIVGDIGKGVLAVLLARFVTADPLVIAATAVGAILGHVYPLYFGFRGGKGVATAAGTFLTLAPIPTLTVVPVFALLIATTRYVSLGSIGAAALLPISCWLWSAPLAGAFGGRFATHAPTVWAATLVGLLVVFKHRENLARLLTGTERKLGEPKRGE